MFGTVQFEGSDGHLCQANIGPDGSYSVRGVAAGLEANDTRDASIFNPANLAEGIGHPPDEIFAAETSVDLERLPIMLSVA